MLPGRFFSPHQTDLPAYIGFIKRTKNEVRPLGNASIGCHLGQQRRANAIGNHLHNRRKTGRLIRHGDIFLPQLTGLQCMITKAMTFLQQQHLRAS